MQAGAIAERVDEARQAAGVAAAVGLGVIGEDQGLVATACGAVVDHFSTGGHTAVAVYASSTTLVNIPSRTSYPSQPLDRVLAVVPRMLDEPVEHATTLVLAGSPASPYELLSKLSP